MEQTVDKNREAWEEDISLQDAMKEVQRAKARINTKKKMQDFAKALDARSQIDRWRKMYEFLANYNPAARRDFDLFNADCKRIKQEQKNWNASGKHIQYGLHMPQILWDALAIVDPEIRDFNNLDKEHQRKIYRKLGQAFPIYWMPRVQPEKIDFTTLWPVGSYYETSDLAFDPNVSWGGTWVQDSKGRATFSYDSTVTEFNTVGKTGGSLVHKHSFKGLTNTNVTSGAGVIGTDNFTNNTSTLPQYVVVVRWHRTA